MTKRMYVLGGSFVLGAVLLGGCASDKRANAIFQDGWVGPTTIAVDRQKTVKPLFCYRTLGEPECFPTEQKGEERRLIGFYIPTPPEIALNETEKPPCPYF